MGENKKSLNEILSEVFTQNFTTDNIPKYNYSAEQFIIEIIKSNTFIFEDKCNVLTKIFKQLSNINFGDDEETNPLILLCCKKQIQNDFNLVKFLVEKIGLEIDTMSKNYTTPIMYAFQAENMDIVKYLLSRGAKIECCKPSGEINRITSYINYACPTHIQLLFDVMKSYSNIIKKESVSELDTAQCTRDEKLKKINSSLMNDPYRFAKKFTDDDMTACKISNYSLLIQANKLLDSMHNLIVGDYVVITKAGFEGIYQIRSHIIDLDSKKNQWRLRFEMLNVE